MPVQMFAEVFAEIQEQLSWMLGIFYYGSHKLKPAHDWLLQKFLMSTPKGERIWPCESGSWHDFLVGFPFPAIALIERNLVDPVVYDRFVF